ncbi:MAG: translocation/assembly module TamB [Deltaproteobacteria bacterium]|nr:MAG: translocation/assembly module TamB [Deltaproteobacteria bacterium]
MKGFYEKESDTFKIESFQILKDKNSLNFNLTATGNEETNNSKIDSQLKGTLNLDWLRYFPIYFHEGRGFADIDLKCTGSSTAPILKGQVKFSDSDIFLRGFSEELNNLTGDIKIDGTTLAPNLSGLWGDGRFSLSGKISLNQGQPENFNLAFKGNNLTFSKNNVYRLDFDTDVTLIGKLPSPLLSGKIDIIEGRYTKPFVIRDLVLKPFEEPSQPSDLELALSSMGLNLTVRNSGDLRVRNNIATLFLQSNLQINGTLGKPKISGALSVTEGTFRFLGREFTLNEGLVEYSNPIRSDPYLTLSAQQDIPVDQPRYTVYVDIRGFLDNLAIQLSSSPSLEKQDIISLLAFGATQEEIRQSGASKRSLTNGVIGEELSSVVAAPLAKTTKIDIFRLEASESGNLSRLSVGKRISDRFTLEFINDLDPITAEKTFQANYYLTDTILLKGYRKSLLGFDPRYELNLLLRFRLH